MEFKVTTDLSVLNPNEIKFNKEEIKTELASRLSMYKGMLVTEENIAEAKKVRANIRKVETAINDEKKRVKNAFTAPYLKFEADVKEIMAMCSEVSEEIDASIKELENQKKQEKRKILNEYFDSISSDVKRFVSFVMIEDPKWMNATVSVDDAKKNIDEMVGRYREDIECVINITEDESDREALLYVYETTHSVSKSIYAYKSMQDAREEAERKKTAQEAQSKQQVDINNAVQPIADESKHHDEPQDVKLEVIEIAFKVWATKNQLDKIRLFLTENGIKYGRV